MDKPYAIHDLNRKYKIAEKKKSKNTGSRNRLLTSQTLLFWRFSHIVRGLALFLSVGKV